LIVGWILWQDKRWGLTILILLLPDFFLVAAFGRGLYLEVSRCGIFLGFYP